MSNGDKYIIREVWAANLEQEMAVIRDILEEYPYIAMVRYHHTDSEFLVEKHHQAFPVLDLILFETLLRGGGGCLTIVFPDQLI